MYLVVAMTLSSPVRVIYRGTCLQVANVKFEQAARKGWAVELYEIKKSKGDYENGKA